MILSFIISAVIVILDQITKYLIYGKMAVSVIGNLLWFESTLNTGVAFGMMKGMKIFFEVFSSISIVVFMFLIVSKNVIKERKLKICLGAIMGGTIGNLIDRFIFGGVRDFIYLKFINFAIFNVADMAVSFGALFFCIFVFIESIKSEKGASKSDSDNTGDKTEGENENNA